MIARIWHGWTTRGTQKTIGTLYALSTFGRIIGTLITSFYIITLAGANALIMGQGVLLVALAIPLFFTKLSCSIKPSGPAGVMKDTK